MIQAGALQRGEVVDRYRLEERLGAGAFGEVWRACQLADGQDVGVTCAVKLMRLAHDRTESSARAFATGWLEEVRNLVRVAGESIPRILEANVWNGHAYIAMELLAGSTLASRLQQGRLPWRRALFIADQIACALEAAHQVGVVHRDLKPQNVVLVGPRRACVIDWGIASLNASTSPPPAAPGVEPRPDADPDATDAGPVAPIVTPRQRLAPVGTPGYMAPEVYEGMPPRREQDVFALGVCLYEMLAGRLPHAVDRPDRTNPDSVKAYRGALDKATMDYALAPLREVAPELPEEVHRLVDALLDRDPARRPTELRKAIARATQFPHGVPDPPYAGLVRLGPERAGLYFGQADAIDHVLDRLRSQRGALLWGPSGSGKSSLALAGVAATMDRELFADTDGWTIHVVRPRDAESLRVRPDHAASARGTLGQVVVIDQLEEVVDLDAAAQGRFCEAIVALLERSHAVAIHDTVIELADETRVIATIRDDLEWRVDREVPALRPLLERRIIVKGVDANFARSIIEEPARALGFEVEGIDAVSREVEERLSADPAKLPVVQYALSEWWERRDLDRKRLPASAWKELGGVDGALSFVAERFYSALDTADQERVQALFLQLLPGGRKQPVPESALTARSTELVQELTRLRLVGRREKQDSAPFYEVEHESLATNWRRLTGWLAEAREDQAMAEELERDAAAYARDHDPERLWKKGRLAAALDMAARGRIALGTGAQRFIADARGQDRRSRRLRAGLIGAAVALVLGAGYVLVLSSAASSQRDQAVRALDAAQAKMQAASADREKAREELQHVRISLDAAERARAEEVKQEQTLADAVQRANQAEQQAESATKKAEQRYNQLERMSKAMCGQGLGGFDNP